MKLAIGIGYSGGRVELPIDMVQRAEQLGYDSVWSAEAYGSDAVTPLAYLAAKTSRIKLGTGILQIPARTPAMCAMTMSTLDALSGGRVLVGLGMSGPQVIEGWHGMSYGRPAARIRRVRRNPAQDMGPSGAGRVRRQSLSPPVSGRRRQRHRQAAQVHPALAPHPRLSGDHEAAQHSDHGGTGRRLAADLVFAVPHGDVHPRTSKRDSRARATASRSTRSKSWRAVPS